MLADFLEFTYNIGIIAHKYSKMSHWCLKLHKKTWHYSTQILLRFTLMSVLTSNLDITVYKYFASHFFLNCYMDTWRYQTCTVSVTFMWAVTKEVCALYLNSLQVSHYSWQILYAFLSWGLNKLVVMLHNDTIVM